MHSESHSSHILIVFIPIWISVSCPPGWLRLPGDRPSSLTAEGRGLHDDAGLGHRVSYGLVRQHVGTVQVELIVHNDILPQHGHILHAHL